MRAFALFSALAAVCGALAAPATSSGCFSELECAPASLAVRGVSNAAVVDAPLKRDTPIASKTSAYSELNNAQRLARGLPLKAPSRRITARTGSPSAPPTHNLRGNLLVRNAANNAIMGYVAKTTASTAYFINADKANALTVSITLPTGMTAGSKLNLAQEDGPNSFPYFGLVQGRDSTTSDINSGSFNYLYLSGTNETPAGSTPKAAGNLPSSSIGNSRTSESAVWTIDTVAGTAVPTWINADGSAATTQLFSQSNALYAGGDKDAFANRYPSPVTAYTLTWVPV